MTDFDKTAGDSAFIEKKALIFGNLFLLANKFQVVGDHYLEKDDLTTKQWFLIAAVMRFSAAPTLSEVAELTGSSRQNVKQLAIKLERRGFLRITRDEQDTRALRLILTEECLSFWQKREARDNRFIGELFNCLTEEETAVLSDYFLKLVKRVDEIHL